MAQRNNLERALTGKKKVEPDQSAPAAAQESSQELFSFVTPTEFVDLPSQGRFYAEGHPLHNSLTVEIRHMTAKEEDILTSESLLKKGIAVDRMLQSLVVDKSLKLGELLIGDKNALLVAARITGFGPHYETKVGCPSCGETIDNSFNLNELDLVSATELPPNVELLPNGNFKATLETIDGFTVELRLLKGNDEKVFSASREKKKKLKLPEAAITGQLKLVVVAVNDVDDGGLIAKFIDAIPTTASREIRAIYEALMPNVDLTQEISCSQCDHEGRISVPLTADFFWPEL
jgi:hypothetical protein